MNGLGFLIWQLANMPPVDKLIPALQAIDCKWISIKVADGIYKYNTKTGDAPLKAFIAALQGAGIEVGGWHYIYPQSPGPQGDLAEERREKLGLQSYLLDVEKEWKGNFAPAARTLMGKLHNGSLQVGLCSYRYPTVHPEIPWSAFITHEKMDVMAPQVYWLEAHNPAEQLQRSYNEYRARTDKPFIPLGSTFSVGGWEPSVDDLVQFVDKCEALQCPAYGFYSLDWIITHQRADWLNAIHDAAGDVPPPPPQSDELEVVRCDFLNGRSAPDPVPDNRVLALRVGQHVTDLHEDSGNWKHVHVELDCWMHGDYLEPA